MATNFCLPAAAVNSFTNALRSGKIDPYKLNQMSSDERRAVFKGIVGENGAKQVNAEFEARMLLKNQKYAYTAWAKKVAGITSETKRDLMTRISKMDHILTPVEEKQFLSDLAAHKLGVGVTPEEARSIANLSQKVQGAEKHISSTETAAEKGFIPTAADMQHGYARYDLQKYVSDLKSKASVFKTSELKTPTGLTQGIAKLPRAVADVSKSIGASLDDSFALRQGSKTLLTHPMYWTKEFKNSFMNIAKGAKNAEAAQREFKARLMADPLYDQAIKDGLAISKSDDVFPTSLPGKIPIAGRAFNASEVAYEAYAENLRMGLYKNELRLAKDKGIDMTGVFGKNVAKMVNSLTGRGSLGALEPVSGPINVAFYSLRFLKSNVDTLLFHPAGAGVGGTYDLVRGKTGARAVSFAQKRAATNLLKIVAGTAAVMGIANSLKPGSVELDPRSSDFGKIKVGDTRFEITGGMDSIVTLASRLLSQSSKSSSTKNVTKLNSGVYGSQTLMDVVNTFFQNKASPVGGVAIDTLKGKTPQGEKPTLKSETLKLVTPLNINNFQELKNDKNSANMLASVLADTFGVSTNTYGKSTAKWDVNTNKTLAAFQKKVGDAKFQQANQDYNNTLDQYMRKLTSSPVYNSLPTTEKKTLVIGTKAKAQDTVLKKYGFKYKSVPDKAFNKTKKGLLKSL